MRTAEVFLGEWLGEEITHSKESMIGCSYSDVIEIMNAYHQEQVKELNIGDVSKSFYYRFVYKDAKGDMGYTVRKVNKQDSELAIASFEKAFPDLVWRRFEEIEK